MSAGEASAPESRPVRRRFAPGTTAADLMEYMGPFAARLGYKFNTDADFVGMVLDGELELLEQTGDVYCPCRMRTGDPKEDAKIICPCIPFYRDQFAGMRKCWCGLFIRADIEDGSTLHGVIDVPPGRKETRVAAVGAEYGIAFDFDRIARYMKRQELAAGEYLFRQGEDGDRLGQGADGRHCPSQRTAETWFFDKSSHGVLLRCWFEPGQETGNRDLFLAAKKAKGFPLASSWLVSLAMAVKG